MILAKGSDAEKQGPAIRKVETTGGKRKKQKKNALG